MKIISSSAEQEKILLEVTQVIATKWEDTMDMELEDIQGMDRELEDLKTSRTPTSILYYRLYMIAFSLRYFDIR